MAKSSIDTRLTQKILEEIQKDKLGGWFDLPYKISQEELTVIDTTAKQIQANSKYLVCIGVGGSYLGHKAVIEAIKPKSPTKVLFAGNSLSSREISEVISEIGEADFSVLVISKSGTTLEPAVAFRIFKAILLKKYGAEEAKKRIYAITDPGAGTLHNEAIINRYTRFDFPENIPGRYAVLSVVGLLPMRVAGVDIFKLLYGARECREKQLIPGRYEESALLGYAFTRRYLYQRGVKIEVLASFEPAMMWFHEWWKQLFAESEGKRKGGIFPASVIYTTDLHSLGQYMQDGYRGIMETVVNFTTVSNSATDIKIPNINQVTDPNMLEQQTKEVKEELLSLDKLQHISDRSLDELNKIALQSVVTAHDAGGISTVVIQVCDEMSNNIISERSLGFLIYFFEVACAISAKLNGVNPFDQPGVEVYKKEMNKALKEQKK